MLGKDSRRKTDLYQLSHIGLDSDVLFIELENLHHPKNPNTHMCIHTVKSGKRYLKYLNMQTLIRFMTATILVCFQLCLHLLQSLNFCIYILQMVRSEVLPILDTQSIGPCKHFMGFFGLLTALLLNKFVTCSFVKQPSPLAPQIDRSFQFSIISLTFCI